MNIIRIESSTLNPVEYASLLSIEWFQRATNCYNDLIAIGDNTHHLDNLNRAISHFNREGIFTYEHVEAISEAERYFYKITVTEETYKLVKSRLTEVQNQIQRLEQIMVDGDQMWDRGVSETEIKEYFRQELTNLYPESVIPSFVELLFLQVSVGKDVRVFLNQEQLDKLKPEPFGLHEILNCPTCLEDFINGESVIQLPCHQNHVFHPNCIVPWLKMSTKCPLCKKDLRELL